jgi:hypothetical protein
MKIIARFLPLILAVCVSGQSAPSTGTNPWGALAFLEGTWEAKATGAAGVTSMGTYAFKPELGNHILARHTISLSVCKGPATFDCEHNDVLYIFRDAPTQPLKAIYFDNEGHVIHYDVSTPSATSAVFLSDSSQPGPEFRLFYELKGEVMSGKFQMRTPGQAEWKSYLEWSGSKRM